MKEGVRKRGQKQWRREGGRGGDVKQTRLEREREGGREDSDRDRVEGGQ